MGQVHELRMRSNSFVTNLQSYIESIVDDNQRLLDLNRKQLRVEHKTAKDKPITPPYSSWTASLKGFRTPDLYDTGELQRTLVIEATKDGHYYISGTTDYTGSLMERYTEDIFGIAPSMQKEAQSITAAELRDLYQKTVLK